MSLSHPEESNAREEFISACMNSDVIQNEFGTQKQRLVCQSQWLRAAKKGKANWQEMEADIKKNGIIITEDEARIIMPGISREQAEQEKKPSFDVGLTNENKFND